MEGATAIGAAFGAIETLMENLALEVGSAGGRAVWLRTTANTDSRTIRQTMEALADNKNVTKDQMIARIASLPTGEAGTVWRLTFGHSYGPRGRARPDPPMN
jgi:hypothetical protein